MAELWDYVIEHNGEVLAKDTIAADSRQDCAFKAGLANPAIAADAEVHCRPFRESGDDDCSDC